MLMNSMAFKGTTGLVFRELLNLSKLHAAPGRKMVQYQVLRSLGIRLYSSRTWMKAGPLANVTVPTRALHEQRKIVDSSQHDTSRQERKITVDSVETLEKEVDPSRWQKFTELLGFKGGYRYQQGILALSGLKLYLCCSEAVDYNKLYESLDLPDTFFTWFLLHELHIWLCMVRLQSEGRSGRLVRQNMIKSLWTDTQKRMKQMQNMSQITIKRSELDKLSDHLRFAVLNYDEGLLCDDRVLATAVWTQFFSSRQVSPDQVELVVGYIRKQAHHLKKQNSDTILKSGFVSFLPLQGDTIDRGTLDDLIKKIQNPRILV